MVANDNKSQDIPSSAGYFYLQVIVANVLRHIVIIMGEEQDKSVV